MDRMIVYDGALPLATDVLNTDKFAMVGQAFQNAAMLGTSTVVAGLSCVPTGPASLQVVVNEGSIYQLDEADASAYGDLGTDTNNIMKQGILYAPKTLTITPPSTSGFSQVFLVEAELSDVDTGSTVLSYFNSTPPNVPFSGPANSGTSQNTIRTCVCTISLKAGTAATTGTQVTPSPDSGFVGLFAITVPNGATTITSGNIVQLATAPFFPTLPAIPADVQSGEWVYALDTGTTNNVVVTLSPVPTQYTAGMEFRVKMANAPTGATVINANGLGNKSVVKSGGVALAGAEWAIGDIVSFKFDGTNFQVPSSGLSTESIKQLIFSPTVVKFTTSGSYSWTVPAGITVAKIIAWGAGGGGGFSATSGGSGGGGGLYAEQAITVTPAGTVSGVVGAGGAAATGVGANGSNGGNSTAINSTGPITYTAGGGTGGASGNGNNNSQAGGTVSTNFVDRIMVGQPSGGTVVGGSSSYAGNGGISPLGGPPGEGGTGGGNSGQSPGGGGAGSGASQPAGHGGDGAVWIYF